MHIRRLKIVIAAIWLGASSAHAATQGTLGATSTGSALISITKSVQAQIPHRAHEHAGRCTTFHPVPTLGKHTKKIMTA